MTCAFSGVERDPFLHYEGKPVSIQIGDYDLWRIVFDDKTISRPFYEKADAVAWLNRNKDI